MSKFKFSAGPWNIHEGADAFGPVVRDSITFEEKVKKLAELGFDAIQFHDDDAVPNMNDLSVEEIKIEARKTKEVLDKYGLKAEFVAPRLWEDWRTNDGGFTSMSERDRNFAEWRSLRSIDIARELGCDKIVLWLAREGTVCYESKDPVQSINRLVDAINTMLDYDDSIKVLVEPKPNEPIDRSFCPTMGHVMGVSSMTKDPSRVGGLVESAHAVLAGLDPANEMAIALAQNKLWGVHLNDQNGMKYDQDKSFGVENIRQAFNQIRVLMKYGFGDSGEYVGLDVKAMRTQPIEDSYRHLINSMQIVKFLVEKVNTFDEEKAIELVANGNYEKLEMLVVSHLLGINI